MMTGNDLREWRKNRNWNQIDLMKELEVNSRQTITNWEAADKLPRIVELSIIALDQVEACRKISGFEKQWTTEIISLGSTKLSSRYFKNTTD